MNNQQVLELLRAADGAFVSGEEISGKLGVTRAAIWKQVKMLREKGYEIESKNNCGYRLVSIPEQLDDGEIHNLLSGHPWQEQVHIFDCIDSTNNALKRDAASGIPDGTVYIADEQTGGRGRQGNSFSSPKGVGVYFSVLLRPDCAPAEVSHVTAMAAVATCDAIEKVCGVRPGIKWTNDLVMGTHKICGILTELSVEWESNALEYLVIGIGINVNHQEKDFAESLWDVAGSIAMETGKRADRNALCAEMVRAMYRLRQEMCTEKNRWLIRYRNDCITVGRQVRVIRAGTFRTGVAEGIDDQGGLLVRYDDTGERGVVYAGEVSVRGLFGYV